MRNTNLIVYMDEQLQIRTIDLHYHLVKEDSHEMDAQIHNKCEAHVIEAINHLADIFDEDIQLDVSAPGEGSVIDKLKITLTSSTAKSIYLVLVGALINHFISPSVSLDETQRMLNRSEVIQKIKQGSFSDEDIEFIISGDSKLLSAKSKYYKELDKEAHVKRVSCSTYGENCPQKAFVSNSIDKNEFEKQIIKDRCQTDTYDFIDINVLVISPVLSKESQAKWKGIFNGEDISFKIKDKDFMQQVYDKEVGFTTGTSLKCDIKIISKAKYDASGDISSNSKDIEVSNITSWFDGETFKHETKRYKRKKKDSLQLSLFKDEDL